MKKILLFLLFITGINLAQSSATYIFWRDTTNTSAAKAVPTKAFLGLNHYTKTQADLLYGAKKDTTNLSGLTGDVQHQINSKVDKVAGKGLSTNDFTNALKAAYDSTHAWGNHALAGYFLSSNFNSSFDGRFNSSITNYYSKHLTDSLLTLKQPSLTSVTNFELGQTTPSTVAYFDLHTISSFSDYSTRFIRESGENGNGQMINRGKGAINLIALDKGSVAFSTDNTLRMSIDSLGFMSRHQQQTNSGGLRRIGFWNTTHIDVNDMPTPYDIASDGYNNTQYIGNTTPLRGSVLGYTNFQFINNLANDSCEIGGYLGTMVNNSPIGGRMWFTDYGLHGSFARPSVLNGITMGINNYYNGSPSGSPSGGMWVVTKHATIAGIDSSHAANNTYSVDVGLGIVGTSSGGNGKGFETGIQIGGYGSAWMASSDSSKIGIGIKIKDYTDYALYIDDSRTSAPNAVGIYNKKSLTVLGASSLSTITSSDQITINRASYPKLIMNSSGNGADAKKWQTYVTPEGYLRFGSLNDLENGETANITFLRNGNADITALKVSGTQVVGGQGASVADATNTSDVITQLNTLLARLRAHGLIAN